MIEDYVIIGLVVLFAVERVSRALESRAWARERRELLNRVQAGSLREYAVGKAMVEPEPEPVADRLNRLAPEYDPPEQLDFVTEQSAFNGLMSR